jgi:serine/threonine protein kinase
LRRDAAVATTTLQQERHAAANTLTQAQAAHATAVGVLHDELAVARQGGKAAAATIENAKTVCAQHTQELATLKLQLSMAETNAGQLLVAERLQAEVIPLLTDVQQHHAGALDATTALNRTADQCKRTIDARDRAQSVLHDLVATESAGGGGGGGAAAADTVTALEQAITVRDAAMLACTEVMDEFQAKSTAAASQWGPRLDVLVRAAACVSNLLSAACVTPPTQPSTSSSLIIATQADCITAVHACKVRLLQQMSTPAASAHQPVDQIIATLSTVVAAFQQRIEHEQQTLLAAVGLRERCVAEGPVLAGAPAALDHTRAAVTAVRDEAYDAEDAVKDAETELSGLRTKIKRAAERGRPPPDGLGAARSKLAAATRAQRAVTKQQDGALVRMTTLVHHFPELLLEFRELTHGVGHGLIMSGKFSARTLAQFDERSSLATHPHLVEYAEFEGEPCVLKHYVVGAESNAAGIRARKQFAKEVDFLLNKLSHPLVMPIISTFFVADAAQPSFCVQLPWFGTMSIDNKTPIASTLEWYVANKHPNGVAKIELIAKVLQALDHIHSRGVIHGDIKPQNIFVEPVVGAHLVIGDFDTSSLADAAATSTTARFTVEYAAPEIRSAGGKGSTVQSDVWSVGQVLHFCFSGAVAAMELGSQSVRIVDASASFPPVVRDAVNAMLQINPARRPSAADASLLPCFSEVKQQSAKRFDEILQQENDLQRAAADLHKDGAALEQQRIEHQADLQRANQDLAEKEAAHLQATADLHAQQTQTDAEYRRQQQQLSDRTRELAGKTNQLAEEKIAAEQQLAADQTHLQEKVAHQKQKFQREKSRIAADKERINEENRQRTNEIHRKEQDVAAAELKLNADAAALKLKAKNLRKQVPDTWYHQGNGTLPLLVDLSHDRGEYKKVAAMLKDSLPDASNIKVERIQNPLLHCKYQSEADAIAARNPNNRKDCNEKWLWHATGDTDPQLLFNLDSKGCDPTFSQLNKHGKSYGVGTYFAKYAIYPHFIFPHKISGGRVQMLVVKVALGKVHDYGSSTPGAGLVQEPAGCNSVGGTEHDCQFGFIQHDKNRPGARGQMARKMLANGKQYGQQYVVFGRTNSYPAYLVTYKHPVTW